MSDYLEKVKKVKRSNEKSWLGIEGVMAVGIGKISDGTIGIIISVKENKLKYCAQIPEKVDDISIELKESGELKAF
jgi:hypothetical protein